MGGGGHPYGVPSGEFWSKTAETVKKSPKFFRGFFKKYTFLFGGPGPGQAAATVWRPKSLQNANEKIFLKIGVIFQGHP